MGVFDIFHYLTLLFFLKVLLSIKYLYRYYISLSLLFLQTPFLSSFLLIFLHIFPHSRFHFHLLFLPSQGFKINFYLKAHYWKELHHYAFIMLNRILAYLKELHPYVFIMLNRILAYCFIFIFLFLVQIFFSNDRRLPLILNIFIYLSKKVSKIFNYNFL